MRRCSQDTSLFSRASSVLFGSAVMEEPLLSALLLSSRCRRLALSERGRDGVKIFAVEGTRRGGRVRAG
jgi:hypothetical protein